MTGSNANRVPLCFNAPDVAMFYWHLDGHRASDWNPRTLEWIALCLENAERQHTKEEVEAARQAIDAYAKQQNAPTQLGLAA